MRRLYLISILLLSLIYEPALLEELKVAIVGAGLGGTSAAYFLSQELRNVKITVFESDKVGGRLATDNIGGRSYETGGSIIHDSNKMMHDLLDKCHLKKKKSLPSETFSVMSSGGPLFQETAISFLDNVRLAWNYGPLQLLKLEKFYHDVLKDFVKIYQNLADRKGYRNMTSFLESMSPRFIDLTKTSLTDHLTQNIGIDDKLLTELVGAATKFNYGQLPDTMHAFVGAVALIGFDKRLWAVEDGNLRVSECLLNLSGAEMVRSEVKDVVNSRGQWKIEHTGATFDVVIIAAPLTEDKSKIRIQNISSSVPGSYHRTVSTIVSGDLNTSSLGLSNADLLTSHYFYPSSTFPVWSVESMTPVDYSEADTDLPSVYRLFSHQPLDEEILDTLFMKIEEVSETDWLAYPQYYPGEDLGRFVLAPGLYYINSVETAASAMEMSVLGARNVVNLIEADFPDKVMLLQSEPDKTEL